MKRWSESEAGAWRQRNPWLVGANYVPRSAINQLEMWQPDTFQPEQIDEELGWAAALGMNSMRLFLHDLTWFADPRGYLKRIDRVLEIAAAHGIGAMVVFFDSVWHPYPRAGKQRPPEPHTHNSGWVQSPGVEVLRDPAKFDQLEAYVTGVVSHFADDPRVQVWDLWNEPDNANGVAYVGRDLGTQKAELVSKYLPLSFEWARKGKPTQPLTTGVWHGEWSSESELTPFAKLQLELSDVISFHWYGDAKTLAERIEPLKRYNRPLLCTEFMARPQGSTFQACLPVLKQHDVGAYCWGLVNGKSQTIYPWDSWQKQYNDEPPLWFHDVFRADGSAYRDEEVASIRKITGAKSPKH